MNENINKLSFDSIKMKSLYEYASGFISIGVKILITLLAMYISIKIGNYLINKFTEKQSKLRFSLDSRKSKTLGAILKSILKYSVYIFGIISILSLFLGPISMTFAGIGGVAIGFGTQSIIKDIINGFFILFEDQFAVGDYVDIEGKSGIVESLELRVTKIRDFNGDLHIIPNGLITKVTNHSRGDMRILVEIDIAYEEDIDNAIEVMDKVCERFNKEDENIVDGPKVLGVSNFKDSGITIKVVGKAKCMTQWDVEMLLRKQIKNALSKANIKMSYPRVIVKG